MLQYIIYLYVATLTNNLGTCKELDFQICSSLHEPQAQLEGLWLEQQEQRTNNFSQSRPKYMVKYRANSKALKEYKKNHTLFQQGLQNGYLY